VLAEHELAPGREPGPGERQLAQVGRQGTIGAVEQRETGDHVVE